MVQIFGANFIMKKNKARTDEAAISANIRLDTRRERANKTFPTKLEIYFKGAKKRYNLKVYFSIEDWEKANTPKLKDQQIKALKSKIDIEKAKAMSIIEDLKDDFSFSNFEKFYLNKPQKINTSKEDVYEQIKNLSKKLHKNDQISYSESFDSTLYSLKKFTPKLTFNELTPSFFTEFEKWMISEGKSLTTIGFYVRNIRVLYNMAIQEGAAKRENYPFGMARSGKYEIPIGAKPKKALPEVVIKRIAELQIQDEKMERARDLWLFSFICNGMNIVDICKLKFSNFDESFFTFYRKKSSGRQKNKNPIEVFLTQKAIHIMQKWGNNPNNENEYVFPFLNQGISAKEELKIVKGLTRSINHYMKKVSQQLELRVNVTTYYSRHSFCTILRDKGTSIPEISESVGHSNVSTTSNYFDRYSLEKKKSLACIIDEIF